MLISVGNYVTIDGDEKHKFLVIGILVKKDHQLIQVTWISNDEHKVDYFESWRIKKCENI